MATSQSQVPVKLEPKSEGVECPEDMKMDLKTDSPDWDNDAEFMVKEEIDIGAHILQPPDIAFMLMDVKKEEGADNIDQNNDAGTECTSDPHISCGEVPPMGSSKRLKKNFICYLCPSTREYKSITWLKKHFHQKHSKRKPKHVNEECYKCNVCNITFNNNRSLLGHVNKKHGSKTFMCNFCKQHFKWRGNLIRHLKNNMCKTNTKEFKTFMCDACNKCYNNKYNLMVHMVHIHLASKQESCIYCKKLFSNTNYLKRHIDFIHLRRRNKKCEFCKKKFMTQNKFDNHKCEISIPFHSRKLPIRCEICQKDYADKQCLLSHNRRVHRRKDEDRKCNICNKLFFGKRSLNRHMNSQHLVSTLSKKCFQPIICNLCGNSYRGGRALTRHMKRTHTTLHPYSCACCMASFKKRYEIIDHLNTCSIYNDVK